MRAVCRSKWLAPLVALALGGVVFGAQAIGGHPGSGLVSLGIMAFTGAIFLYGGRSETIRGIRGDGRDERFQRIDMHATAFAGLVIIAAIIVAFIVELAHGRNGNPYSWLGALGGIAYLAALLFMRVRG